MGEFRGTPRAARIAAPVILAIALLASPRTAPGAEPDPRGHVALELEAGGADVGAPQILLGGGWALVETGTLRLDLFLRAGFSQSKEFHVTGDASLQAVSGHLDLAAAWRIGRFEPFAGGGVALVGVSGTLENPPSQTQRLDGTSIWGGTAFAGLRVAISDQLLLGAELRYQKKGRSSIEGLPFSMPVGGTSGLLTATWRLSTAAQAASAMAPKSPAPPAAGEGAAPAPTPSTVAVPLSDECAPGKPVWLSLHPARSYRCFADPVRGGHYCEPGAALGEFVDAGGCEAACRGGSAACPTSAIGGAACARCLKGCAEPRTVPCPTEPGWVEGRPVCLLPEGTYGLESERAVPASCTGRTGGR
jgi:hypothetical protein